MKLGQAIVAVLPLLCAAPQSGAAQLPCPIKSTQARPWLDTGLSPQCRADALIAQLGSLDDKLAVLGGGLNRYGVTEPRASDGPAGPTHVPGVASLPNGLAVASSFDVDMAHAYGRAVGGEFHAAGILQMLGPTVDIARTWHSGRVPEAFGEDPLLSGAMAANVVRGVQEQGVAATLKHFAVYEQEQGRTGDLPFGLKPAVNNIVSERVIREIYLAPFRAAVEEGGALGVMCAFPRINGVYACENPLLLGILKNEWGFRGTVAPDFPDAQRSVIAAVNAGLDAGNFGPSTRPTSSAAPAGGSAAGPDAGLGAALGLGAIPGGVSLQEAVRSGKVSGQRLDDMIRRRLIVLFAAQPAQTDSAARGAREIALRIAEQGAVLLQNRGHLLPLHPQLKSIAVFGAQAGPTPQVATSGSAYIEPAQATTAFDEVKARAGGAVRLTYVQGSLGLDALPLIPAAVLHTPEGSAGLRVEYVGNPRLDFGAPRLLTRTDPGPDVHGPAPIAGLPANNGWSARWSGTLTPRVSGIHHFTLSGAGSGRLYFDDRLVARFDRVDFGTVAYAAVMLTGGRAVRIRVEFTPREAAPAPDMHMMGTTLGILLQLGWAEPDDRVAQAVAAAKQAEVAVVFAANRQGEGADRLDLSLPGDQNELIAAVAAANPNTIVVLSTGGPVAMPWADQVAAILETWYAGDAFAVATTRLLFGDAFPAGRLPITFPVNDEQGPLSSSSRYPGTVSPDGSLADAHFDEGLLVGYRWFDATHTTPLFAFGQGLTYSTMRIDHIQVTTTVAEPRIEATITNAGSRADAEALQVYLAFPDTAGEPPRRLVAFQKVALAPAQSRRIELSLPARAFEVWDEREHHWYTPSGRYEIQVGRSSREILFRQSFVRR